MRIVTEYPIWLIIFCLVTAFFAAWMLYRKDGHFTDVADWKLKALASLRFLLVFLLAFFLLSPMIKSISRYIEKPVIIVAQDNSESVVISKDSLFYRNEYRDLISKMVNELSENYDVKTYSFGEKLEMGIRDTFDGKATNFSLLFDEIESRYSNRNVGALIIASDGIYNKGKNPLFSFTGTDYPVYTIAMGDTSIQRDALIGDILYNHIAFLGNRFPVQISLNFSQLAGEKTQFGIFSGNDNVYSEEITVPENDYSRTVNVQLDAGSPGLKRYKIVLSPVNNEVSIKNNTRYIAVDIIDGKQKVMILANSPHPDVGAICRALSINQNF
ncbi:MAG: hypothetical protein KJ607_09810, partial [Bacteroidetes bacterium]|nr:hypothetical protein [Bacteroidota bacterium]